MRLRPEQLSAHLQQRLLPLYLVSGEETLLVQEACDAIRRKAREAGCSEREVLEVDRRFNWDTHYPPYDLTPRQTFDADSLKYHPQGFVHTNHPFYKYAGSHSDDKHGSVFIIQQNDDGTKGLAKLIESNSHHPGGVHTFGQYVAFPEGTFLRFVDLENPNETKSVRYRVPPSAG